ncbi:D-alanyl-D-alanine carboxypeptidase family protein [Frondihabitans sp. VKM Ac-2883]|uniref:D-alanyl-D-alanine carboxypeptidase family protein n=1 Tax=Frondihabitans sp. VKM Ac-2883 TaxID=2783823 RepID=UPI00188C0C9F|nr:D-alanyl-D-alanine carboxypeptidase family protein [Frondihabitans sp. VKM Ac-2883]MBF4574665.1 D-alanyl-D-alanine carboxypeptidase family protein [Frondihabitans sp. VKM Ac-2883]
MAFSNGQAQLGVDVVKIPQSESLHTNGDQYIARDVLPYLIAAALAFFHGAGVALWVEEAYRPYTTQVAIFRARYTRKLFWRLGAVWWDGSWWVKNAGASTAAVPGTSIHGYGRAVDIWSGVNSSFGSTAHLVWVAVAKVFGWLNTGISFGEPWHQEWDLSRVTTTISGAGTGPFIPIDSEEDDMYTDADRKRDVKAADDAAAARVNANQANERALKTLEEVRAFAAGVGALVWGYKFSAKVDGKTYSASGLLRTLANRARALYEGTAPKKEK